MEQVVQAAPTTRSISGNGMMSALGCGPAARVEFASQRGYVETEDGRG